jgi:hypothetical protein
VSDLSLLTPDEALPEVARAPAPWTLRGAGWILLLRLPEAARRGPGRLPPELRSRPVGGPSILMFVAYADSPAGPYRELLYMPGRFQAADGVRAWSVTRIFVSSWESVVNGRLNWGIPKELATFECSPTEGGERIDVTVGERRVASLALHARGPALPVSAGLLPGGLRRLVQYHGARRFEFTPTARGRAGLASVEHLETDPELLGDFAAARVSLALRIPGFRLHFPAADSRPR